MSLSTLVVLVWSTMLSALHDVSVMSSTSSVTSFSIKVSKVVVVSGLGSNTFTVSKISANDISTPVVIPEVVGGQWSPGAISGFSFNPTFSGDSEF
jgi:hypothetical protein